MSDTQKKPVLRSATWPFIFSLVVTVLYVALFYALKKTAADSFDATMSALPSAKLFGSSTANTVRGYFASYGALAGVVLGLAYALTAYVLLGVFALVRLAKTSFGVSLCCLLASLPLAALGYGLANQADKYTAIAAGAVYFVGRPLMYAGLATTFAAAVLFALSFKYGKDKVVA